MSFLCQRKRGSRLRRNRGGLVTLCLIATFALVLGTGMLKQQPSQPQEPLQEPSIASVMDSGASPVSFTEKQDMSFEVASDSDYGDYEKGTVLLLVDETTNLDQVNAALDECDFAYTKDVSDQDSSAGFVRVSVADDVSMKSAIAAFKDEGLQAQPNYVYYPVEGVAEDSVSLETASVDGNETPDSSEEIVKSDALEASEETDASLTPENDFDTIA